MRVKIHKNKKRVIIITIILLAATAIVIIYWNLGQRQPQEDTPKIEMNRTETEKQISDQLKKNPDKKEDNSQRDQPASPNNTESGGKTGVNVLLTSTTITNSKVVASGFITNAVDNGGRCTFVFKRGDQIIKKISTTETNPTSTTCITVQVESSSFTSGTWSVYIEYESDRYKGVSNQKEVSL